MYRPLGNSPVTFCFQVLLYLIYVKDYNKVIIKILLNTTDKV